MPSAGRLRVASPRWPRSRLRDIEPRIHFPRFVLSLTIAIETPRQEGVIRLLDLSSAYAESLYPPESNHILDLASLERPDVTFWVARIDGDIVGCCALVDAGDGTAEIKRMFVDTAARGRSVARKLMETLEAAALEKRLSALRLETGIYQPEAIGLYRKFGYAEIPAFGDYRPDPLSLFMEKRLPAE
ncbi:MAG: GNAT family N-acetyltransferase [Cupriavidus sp.]|nr:MAG: GNAT family N-acetyltransferase [Cupriavidus sp.]